MFILVNVIGVHLLVVRSALFVFHYRLTRSVFLPFWLHTAQDNHVKAHSHRLTLVWEEARMRHAV